jgi:hypothetical protein
MELIFYRSRVNKRMEFRVYSAEGNGVVIKFLLWCILLVLCWPLALAALLLYPIVWLLLLPFRVVGIAVEGALGLVWVVVTLPLRMARAVF